MLRVSVLTPSIPVRDIFLWEEEEMVKRFAFLGFIA